MSTTEFEANHIDACDREIAALLEARNALAVKCGRDRHLIVPDRVLIAFDRVFEIFQRSLENQSAKPARKPRAPVRSRKRR